jgi:hypothetical protein
MELDGRSLTLAQAGACQRSADAVSNENYLE